MKNITFMDNIEFDNHSSILFVLSSVLEVDYIDRERWRREVWELDQFCKDIDWQFLPDIVIVGIVWDSFL